MRAFLQSVTSAFALEGDYWLEAPVQPVRGRWVFATCIECEEEAISVYPCLKQLMKLTRA